MKSEAPEILSALAFINLLVPVVLVWANAVGERGLDIRWFLVAVVHTLIGLALTIYVGDLRSRARRNV